MNVTRLFPVVIAGAMLFAAAGCNVDPWAKGNGVTDKVTITKITEFGKAPDGVTPLKANVGAVMMSHKTHAAQGLDCAACHHKQHNPQREKVCAKCHIGDNGYERMHGLCLDCHIAKKDGPQKCMECHMAGQAAGH
ncbi:MAG TPA: cytochrome c3 family protein [Spirochaetota bacterium]|nr:cytochrome c3 family protein [Spirochaetota bacterium]HSA16313.1 cytochrome c3 family protein [Spirochaetota bacterium]